MICCLVLSMREDGPACSCCSLSIACVYGFGRVLEQYEKRETHSSVVYCCVCVVLNSNSHFTFVLSLRFWLGLSFDWDPFGALSFSYTYYRILLL